MSTAPCKLHYYYQLILIHLHTLCSHLVIFAPTFFKLSLVPSSPSSLIGYPSSESSVYITWTLPRKPNGVITHHTVYYRCVTSCLLAFSLKAGLCNMLVHVGSKACVMSSFQIIRFTCQFILLSAS